jgi:glycosyltransferase involved in cell wall biosynthesis
MNYGKRTCVLVLGMHRSGTSVLAGTLKILGVSFGDKLIAPGGDNVRGYFEHSDFLHLNRDFLVSFGLDGDGRYGELPADWLFDARTVAFKENIKAIIQDQFSDTYIFGLKDPRVSILLPAYLEVLKELGVEIRVVVSVRNVAEVVASLAKRNEMAVYDSVRAYAYFYRVIDQYTKDIPTIRVSYHDLLRHTQDVVNQLIRSVHYSLRPYVDVADQLAAFIEPTLKHHELRDEELLVKLAQDLHYTEKELIELRSLRAQDMGWWQERVDSFIRLTEDANRVIEDAHRERDDLKRKQMFMESALRELERVHSEFKHEVHTSHEEAEKHRMYLESLVAERESQIQQLHIALTNVERSVVWKSLRVWDMGMRMLLPKDTVIHRWYFGALRRNQYFFNEWLPDKVVRRLKKVPAVAHIPKETEEHFWERFTAAHPQVDILFASHDASRTGAPRIVFDVAEWLQKKYKVAMALCAGGSMQGDFQQAFGPVITVYNLYPHKTEFEKATEIITRLKPKLVYVNSVSAYQFARAAKALGVPVVFHLHELDIAFRIVFNKKERAEFKTFADVFIAVSKPVYDLLVDKLGCAPERVKLIHAFVNRDRILEQAGAVPVEHVDAELHRSPHEVLVLGLGMFVYRKGADIFMQLAKRMVEKGLPCKFVWIGSRPFKEPFMADFATYAPYFTLLHEKTNPFPYLRAADIFVLPSREDPFPLVVLESMALGKPTVIFNDAGGIQEAVKDAGLSISNFDVDAFADALETLIVSQTEREILGAKAVGHQFTYDSSAVLPRIQEVVEEALSV